MQGPKVFKTHASRAVHLDALQTERTNELEALQTKSILKKKLPNQSNDKNIKFS